MNFRAPLTGLAELRSELSDTLAQQRSTLSEISRAASMARIVLAACALAVIVMAVAIVTALFR